MGCRVSTLRGRGRRRENQTRRTGKALRYADGCSVLPSPFWRFAVSDNHCPLLLCANERTIVSRRCGTVGNGAANNVCSRSERRQSRVLGETMGFHAHRSGIGFRARRSFGHFGWAVLFSLGLTSMNTNQCTSYYTRSHNSWLHRSSNIFVNVLSDFVVHSGKSVGSSLSDSRWRRWARFKILGSSWKGRVQENGNYILSEMFGNWVRHKDLDSWFWLTKCFPDEHWRQLRWSFIWRRATTLFTLAKNPWRRLHAT